MTGIVWFGVGVLILAAAAGFVTWYGWRARHRTGIHRGAS